MTITEGIKEKVEISLKLNKTFHFIRNSFRVSSKLLKFRYIHIRIRSNQDGSFFSFEGICFSGIFSIYRHYQMRGELLHCTWTFLLISTFQMGKTPKSVKLSADKHSTDKLLMVMRDLSSRSISQKGFLH